MDYNQDFEELLQTHCDICLSIMQLISQLVEYSDNLARVCSENPSDIYKIEQMTHKIKSIFLEVDALSARIHQDEETIVANLYYYPDYINHPLYLQMKKLLKIASKGLILFGEIKLKTLVTECKQILDIDNQIQEVPMNKKQVFFIYPDK